MDYMPKSFSVNLPSFPSLQVKIIYGLFGNGYHGVFSMPTHFLNGEIYEDPMDAIRDLDQRVKEAVWSGIIELPPSNKFP